MVLLSLCPDLNECGLKPRPCEHRCMNTFGSYMCYCLNGYMLMPDGSCSSKCPLMFTVYFLYTRLYLHVHLLNWPCFPTDSRTCSLAHCQYGCEEVQGEIRCLCPSTGLQLSSDGKTCIGECEGFK